MDFHASHAHVSDFVLLFYELALVDYKTAQLCELHDHWFGHLYFSFIICFELGESKRKERPIFCAKML